jgi:hypothetical protein
VKANLLDFFARSSHSQIEREKKGSGKSIFDSSQTNDNKLPRRSNGNLYYEFINSHHF